MNGLNSGSIASQLYGTSYSETAPAVPCGPIESRLREIQKEQQATHNIIDQLEQRLELALAHKADAKVGGGPQPVRGGDSPLHGGLGDLLDHSEGINARLRNILNRITL